jgi:hypothetical protein
MKLQSKTKLAVRIVNRARAFYITVMAHTNNSKVENKTYQLGHKGNKGLTLNEVMHAKPSNIIEPVQGGSLFQKKIISDVPTFVSGSSWLGVA